MSFPSKKIRKTKVNRIQKEKEMNELMDWLNTTMKNGDMPRVTSIVDYAHSTLALKNLSAGEIAKRVRLQPSYVMTSRQQRQRLRSGKHRPIQTYNLGNLHCDIGFYSVERHYETPITYRSGFLVAKDVLSRMIYVTILRKNRTAKSMINAFTEIFEQYEKQNPGHQVQNVSFDREKSVMSHAVQNFFKENNVDFHSFQMTSSKAKMAEGAIRLLRETVKRIQDFPGNENKRWWNLLEPAAQILNSREIKIDGKKVGYSPKEVTYYNLEEFISRIYKAAPAIYFNQFDVNLPPE